MSQDVNPMALPMAEAMLAVGKGGRGDLVAEAAILAAIMMIGRCAPPDQHPAALRYAARVMEANAEHLERQTAERPQVIQ